MSREGAAYYRSVRKRYGLFAQRTSPFRDRIEPCSPFLSSRASRWACWCLRTSQTTTGRSPRVARNDNWPTPLTTEYTAYEAATARVGAFPLLPGSKDAGLLVDLPAGAYTMHATGGTGVVLLEIYLVR